MQVSEQDRAPTGAAVPRRFGVRAPSMARVTVWALLLGTILMPRTGEAQDATWSAHPVSNDWNDPANWSSNFPPTGTATFGASSQTAITAPQIVSVGTIVLNSDAPAYRFSVGLNFTDRGIVNNSNFAPVFDSGVSFSNASSAGNAIINTTSGGAFSTTPAPRPMPRSTTAAPFTLRTAARPATLPSTVSILLFPRYIFSTPARLATPISATASL